MIAKIYYSSNKSLGLQPASIFIPKEIEENLPKSGRLKRDMIRNYVNNHMHSEMKLTVRTVILDRIIY